MFAHVRGSNFKGLAYQETRSLEKGHGREEGRRYWLVTDQRWVDYVNEEERCGG